MKKNFTLFLMFFCFVASSFGATVQWDGSESNDWNDPLNWGYGTPGLPGVGDYAYISGAFTVDITGSVTIKNIRIVNATLNIMASGTLTCTGSDTSGEPSVYVQGPLNNNGIINAAATLHAVIQVQNSTFTNDGTVNITSSSNNKSGLTMTTNTSVFTNNGMLNIGGINGTAIHVAAATATFTNSMGATTTLGGSGSITVRGIFNQGIVNNNGSLSIDDSANAAIQNQAGVTITNTGALTIGTNKACNHMGIRNYGAITNSGMIDIGMVALNRVMSENASTFANSGTLKMSDAGAVHKSYNATGTGLLTNTGTVQGGGMIEAKVGNFDTSGGTISPGASPGEITIVHAYTNGTFVAELASAASFDTLTFDHGTVVNPALFKLGGTLDVQLLSMYLPITNTEFEIITAADGYSSIMGENEFATIDWPTAAIDWEVAYNTTNVTIKYVGAGPLPIQLTSFTANSTTEAINLKWETASEESNKGFQIEKSSNGRDWSNMAWVDGSETTTLTSNYRFTDNTPIDGLNYYRLKQIDFDGDFEYSNIIQATWKKSETHVTLYPNPAHDIINITLPTTEEVKSIKVFDTVGRMVMELNTSETQIHIDGLDNGIYTIQIQTKVQSHMSTFVKN